MRIGIATEYFDRFYSGGENWTYQFVERLLRRGHEVHVVAHRFSQEAETLPLTPHCVEFAKGRLARAEAVAARLRSLNLDVIHDMGIGWYCDVAQSQDGSKVALWARKLPTLPRFVRPFKRAELKILPRYREHKQLMKRQLHDAHRLVLAISHLVASDYQRFHGIPEERLRIIHFGVDTENFSPRHRAEFREPLRRQLGLGDADLLVLFVGHDFRRKGLLTAVRAINRLASAEVRVRLAVVGGNAANASWLKERVAVDPARILLVGSMNDVRPYYAAADVCVLPSFYDPFGLSVLEAAASGLPSITTHLAGVAELLTEGVDGFLLPDPADDETLADYLRILFDPLRRRQMGEAARTMALNNTLDMNCERILALYEEVIRRGLNRHRLQQTAAA
jgi:UDP-glucose:(heptosyl)LPS alpha-1,3-glucosyltransferase